MSRYARQALNAYYNRDRDELLRIINFLETSMDKNIVASIARVAHEVNKAYCASHGDHSQPGWDFAPEWQRKSAMTGVEMHLSNPDATPEDSHKSWMAEKEAAGWKYGAHKDEKEKLHPCMVPYADLDERQRSKDWIFRGVVHAIAHEMARND